MEERTCLNCIFRNGPPREDLEAYTHKKVILVECFRRHALQHGISPCEYHARNREEL